MTRRCATGVALALTAVVLTTGCAAHGTAKTSIAPNGDGERDLVVLLPDPGTAIVGRVTVSNASGSVELAAARAATTVTAGRAPSKVTTLSASDVREFDDVLATLPPAPDHFMLNFLFDSDELTPESRTAVPSVLAAVKGRPVPEVLVLGHTDTAGRAAANIALGMKRATIVRKLLVENGLSAALIETDSHGEADLLVPTADDVAEPRNRRVEITVR